MFLDEFQQNRDDCEHNSKQLEEDKKYDRPITIGEQAFAAYSNFINSCKEYPVDQEDDEDYEPDPWVDYEQD